MGGVRVLVDVTAGRMGEGRVITLQIDEGPSSLVPRPVRRDLTGVDAWELAGDLRKAADIAEQLPVVEAEISNATEEPF